MMMSLRSAITLTFCAFALVAQAALTGAWWRVEPSTPYAGQPYTLLLNVETGEDEEVKSINVPILPQGVTAEVSSEVVGEKRRTEFRIEQFHSEAQFVTLPETTLRVEIQTLTKGTSGFYMMHTRTQRAMISAFSYEVEEPPAEAEGAILGDFSVQLLADKTTFQPGEVLELTVQLTMREGRAPETLDLQLEDEDCGRRYPFYVTSQSKKKLVAKSYYVPLTTDEITLRLKPIKGFNTRKHAVSEVVAPPLVLTPALQEEQTPQAITLHVGGRTLHGLPLRFAPREGALVIGALTAPYVCHEVHGEWTRVSCESGDGWILTTCLGDDK